MPGARCLVPGAWCLVPGAHSLLVDLYLDLYLDVYLMCPERRDEEGCYLSCPVVRKCTPHSRSR